MGSGKIRACSRNSSPTIATLGEDGLRLILSHDATGEGLSSFSESIGSEDIETSSTTLSDLDLEKTTPREEIEYATDEVIKIVNRLRNLTF